MNDPSLLSARVPSDGVASRTAESRRAVGVAVVGEHAGRATLSGVFSFAGE